MNSPKYKPLIDHLEQSPGPQIELSFDGISKLLGTPLPDSAFRHSAWWANSKPGDSHTWAHAWRAAGWKVGHLDLTAQKVVFQRIKARSGAGLTNWEKVVAALSALGGSATAGEIHDQLVKTYGDFDSENVRKDLVMMSVNDESRFAYRAWKTRKGVAASNLDRVFAGAGSGRKRCYELFDPARHGVWEVYAKPGGGPGLRPALSASEAAAEAAGSAVEYDPKDKAEGKSYAMRAIAVRRGAPKFRKDLLAAYGKRCCVSGCEMDAVLEAAHIRPYDGAETNHPTNGLLLRADLHTLFDLGLFVIDPKALCIHLHPKLRSAPDYQHLHGKKILVGATAPSSKSLSHHWSEHKNWEG